MEYQHQSKYRTKPIKTVFQQTHPHAKVANKAGSQSDACKTALSANQIEAGWILTNQRARLLISESMR